MLVYVDTLGCLGLGTMLWPASLRIGSRRPRIMKNSHRYLLWYALLRYAQGCTTVVVNATGGGTVIGRTMELGIPLPDRASNTIWSLVATQRDEKRFGYAAISAALGDATSDAFVV